MEILIYCLTYNLDVGICLWKGGGGNDFLDFVTRHDIFDSKTDYSYSLYQTFGVILLAQSNEYSLVIVTNFS